MHVKTPNGTLAVRSFKLFPRAPITRSARFGSIFRRFGIAMPMRPDK